MSTIKNRTKRPTRSTTKLKMWLLASSLIATMAGTHLLNTQNAPQVIAAAVDNNDNNPIIVMEPETTTIQLIPRTQQKLQVVPRPIPQVKQPQFRPVARTRSSN